MFAGCRNGSCFGWDTRIRSLPVMSIKEPPVGSRLSSSVIGLHPLHDYNYIVSSALNSRVSEVSWQQILCMSWHYQLCSYPCGTLECREKSCCLVDMSMNTKAVKVWWTSLDLLWLQVKNGTTVKWGNILWLSFDNFFELFSWK